MNKKRIVLLSGIILTMIIGIILSITSYNPQRLKIFSLPYYALASLVKASATDLTSDVNSVFSWILFIILGALPLIYPIVQIIRRKTNLKLYLSWLSVLPFSYLALYYYINPTHLKYVISNNSDFTLTTLTGLSFSVFALIILLLIVEAFIRLRVNDKEMTKYARILIYVSVIILTLNITYFSLGETISDFKKFVGGEDDGINKFNLVFKYILDLLPILAQILTFSYVFIFLEKYEVNQYDSANLISLKRIYYLLTLAIVISISCSIIGNTVTFILQEHLYMINYSFNVDLLLIFISILAGLFVSSLTKQIKLKEENDLTI